MKINARRVSIPISSSHPLLFLPQSNDVFIKWRVYVHSDRPFDRYLLNPSPAQYCNNENTDLSSLDSLGAVS